MHTPPKNQEQMIKNQIEFFYALNDRGKAEFILTLPEEQQQPFLDALEKDVNKYVNNKRT